ncbi:hypothetical protein VNI00_006861 [Paramarasmius palmivorus]|uniref:Uncharacterized protein n=1 Tax=Paramarasmius palmivorus TaxID=297713 RepID=A0AAW0D813_9AGAR
MVSAPPTPSPSTSTESSVTPEGPSSIPSAPSREGSPRLEYPPTPVILQLPPHVSLTDLERREFRNYRTQIERVNPTSSIVEQFNQLKQIFKRRDFLKYVEATVRNDTQKLLGVTNVRRLVNQEEALFTALEQCSLLLDSEVEQLRSNGIVQALQGTKKPRVQWAEEVEQTFSSSSNDTAEKGKARAIPPVGVPKPLATLTRSVPSPATIAPPITTYSQAVSTRMPTPVEMPDPEESEPEPTPSSWTVKVDSEVDLQRVFDLEEPLRRIPSVTLATGWGTTPVIAQISSVTFADDSNRDIIHIIVQTKVDPALTTEDTTTTLMMTVSLTLPENHVETID